MSDRRPRVLYLVSHPIQYQAPMLRHLAASGRIDVHTLFVRTIGSAEYRDPGFGVNVRWDIPLTSGYSHEFLRGWGPPDKVSRLTPVSRGLWAAADRFAPDAVWLHGYDSVNALQLIAWAKARRVPVMVRAEVEWSDAHGGPALRRIKDGVLRAAFPGVDAFLTIGAKNADFYRAHGVPDRKLFSVPYAVDNARFAPPDGAFGAPSTAQRFGLDPGLPTFLFSGKLIARKRPLDAVEALAQLRDVHREPANLVYLGSGELEASLRRRVAELELQEHVALPGFVNQSELPALYAGSTALLLTSERERWGLVANEAMAAGCPVVVYRSVGCADDLVVDGDGGLVVESGNVAGLAAAMSKVADAQVQASMARSCVAQVSRFDFEAIERGLLAALAAVT